MLSGAGSRLLTLQLTTRFVMADSGRLLHENDPAQTLAPRLYIGGSSQGNILRLRHDVGGEIAEAIERLAPDEPPLSRPDSTPLHLDDYMELLSSQSPVVDWHAGLTWSFPGRLAYQPAAPVVCSGTGAGDLLLEQIKKQGMPAELLTLGFLTVDDFWAPWCAVFHERQIASIAFSARLGPTGAEVGVVTVPALRACGYASTATAGWASLPEFRGHSLFYSTHRTNAGSRGVAEKLGLRFLGASLAIT